MDSSVIPPTRWSRTCITRPRADSANYEGRNMNPIPHFFHATRSVLICVAASLPYASTGAAPQGIAHVASGSWVGTYFCNQGLTNLNLEISQSSDGEIRAVFNFYPHPSLPDMPTGSFHMRGSYIPATRELNLVAGQWINQPAGYNTVNLTGKLSEGGQKFTGKVGGHRCTTFALTKP